MISTSIGFHLFLCWENLSILEDMKNWTKYEDNPVVSLFLASSLLISLNSKLQKKYKQSFKTNLLVFYIFNK